MSFRCQKCGHCCKNGIIILYPEDVVSISHYLNMTAYGFLEKYCKSTFLSIQSSEKLQIYYLDNKNGCVFLTCDNLCLIHDVKPLQCKFGPERYFNSIGTWKNCKQYVNNSENPFEGRDIPDKYFVQKLIAGYNFSDIM